jgi:hypothetical protein
MLKTLSGLSINVELLTYETMSKVDFCKIRMLCVYLVLALSNGISVSEEQSIITPSSSSSPT